MEVNVTRISFYCFYSNIIVLCTAAPTAATNPGTTAAQGTMTAQTTATTPKVTTTTLKPATHLVVSITKDKGM